MADLRTRSMTRQQIAEFIPDPRGVRAFEAVQSDIIENFSSVAQTQFLTLTDDPTLGAERIFKPVAGQLIGTDGGPNGNYTLGLADTGVTGGTYGPAGLVGLTIDTKGRVTAAQSYTVGSGLTFAAGVLSAKTAGTYGAPTGSVARATFATYTAPTISTPPTQAEVQAIAAAVQVVSQTLAALITDLKANGNLL